MLCVYRKGPRFPRNLLQLGGRRPQKAETEEFARPFCPDAVGGCVWTPASYPNLKSRAPDAVGWAWTRTEKMPQEKNVRENPRFQIECENRRQIECQNICQKECQNIYIYNTYICMYVCIYIYICNKYLQMVCQKLCQHSL